MPDFTYIYALIDPRTNNVCYIGKANNPQVRLANHMQQCRPTPAGNWMRELKTLFMRPILIVLEQVPYTSWKDKERWWVSYYNNIGSKLLNQNPGGNGTIEHTDEAKHRISEKLKGRKFSDAHKKHLSEMAKKRGVSQKCRDAGRVAATGRPKTPEELKKLSIARSGMKLPDWYKKKIGDAKRSAIYSQEFRERVGRANAKLSDDDVKSIREELMSGAKSVELGKRYNVCEETITNIKYKRSYRWVK